MSRLQAMLTTGDQNMSKCRIQDYEIQVYSPDNQGKYVLAIGDREAFPFGELVKTYLVLPRLKSEFFGKSPFSAYSNMMGIFLGFMLLVTLIIAAILYFGIRVIKKRLKVTNQMNRH